MEQTNNNNRIRIV